VRCTRKLCKRTILPDKLYCQCGAVFCSEPCFVSEWFSAHKKTCPSASAIEASQAASNKPGRAGTAALVAAALSRTPPQVATEASTDRDVQSETVEQDEQQQQPPPPAERSQPPQPQPTESNPLSTADTSSSALRAKADNDPPPSAATISASAAAAPEARAAPLEQAEHTLDRTMPMAVVCRSPPPPPPPATDMESSRSSSASSSPGKTRYKLEDFSSDGSPLGNGSYGVVQRVRHKTTGELYAMKVIPKRKVVEHKMTEYLHREVKTQSRLRHPNVLRLHYYFEDAEKVYLLLEYASAGSLFSVLRKRRRLTEREAAPVFLDVAKGLQHLHQNGIVHRDLKPENILMCDGMVAKLADFGWCAEIEKDGAPRHTFCGTMDYLSPEMVQNQPHDHTVDVWSLGVLLFEMLVGKAPFTAASQVKALTLITTAELEVPDFISPLASDLMRNLVVKNREKRLSLQATIEHPWVRSYCSETDDMSAAAMLAAASHAVHRQATEAIELDNKKITVLEVDNTCVLPQSTLQSGPLDAATVAMPSGTKALSSVAAFPPSLDNTACLDATRIVPNGAGTNSSLAQAQNQPGNSSSESKVQSGYAAPALGVPVPGGLDISMGASVRNVFRTETFGTQNQEKRPWDAFRNGLGTDVVSGPGSAALSGLSSGAAALAPPKVAGLELSGIHHTSSESGASARSRQVVWSLHEPELVTPPQVQKEPPPDASRSRSVSPAVVSRVGSGAPALSCLLDEEHAAPPSKAQQALALFNGNASSSSSRSPGLDSLGLGLGWQTSKKSSAISGGAYPASASKALVAHKSPEKDDLQAGELLYRSPTKSSALPGDGIGSSPLNGHSGTRSKSCAAKYHSEFNPSWTDSQVLELSARVQAVDKHFLHRANTEHLDGSEALSSYSGIGTNDVDARPKWAARPKRRVDRRCSAPSGGLDTRELPTVQLEY